MRTSVGDDVVYYGINKEYWQLCEDGLCNIRLGLPPISVQVTSPSF